MKRMILTSIILMLINPAAYGGEFGAIRRNNDGARKFNSGKQVEAYDRFMSALGDLPFSGVIHYNLGTSFLQTKEFDKALSEFKEAARLSPGDSKSDREVRFRSLFNSAVALSELKKPEEALELYQQALEIVPESIETKTNMELLAASGKGGGGGDKDQKEKKDDKGDQKNDQSKGGQQPNPQQQDQRPQPKPFQSKDLSQQDVARILEELKRQEEQVRAKMNHQGAKDVPPDKDW